VSRLAIPTWLLRTFGSGPSVDVLVGDLTEERRLGRSAAWLWQEALLGIVVTFIAAVRAHPITTAAAVGCGWVLLWGISQVVFHMAFWIITVVEVYVPGFAPHLALTSDGRWALWNPWVQVITAAVAAAAAGGLLAAAFRRHQVVAVLSWVASFCLWMCYLHFVATPPPLPPGARWMEVPWWHSLANGVFPVVHVIAQLAGGLALRCDRQQATGRIIVGR
jgi:hypothetical protein